MTALRSVNDLFPGRPGYHNLAPRPI